MKETNTKITRRNLLKTGGIVAGMSVTATGIPNVVYRVEATDSGSVEIETDVSKPDTSTVELTVYEYLDGGDTVSNQQTRPIGDGVQTTVFDGLDGAADWDEDRNVPVADVDYEYEITLEPTDDLAQTPEFGPFTVTLPVGWAEESITEPLSAQPDHVEIYYNQEELRTYQPLLVLSNEARQSNKGMYAYAASSPEYEYDVYCYWVQYTHQGGLPLISSDSHLGDHEPIYVYVNKDTEEVDSVVYSGYHWFASEVSFEDSPGQFVQDRHSEHATHAKLKVVSPWHNYTANTQARGVFVPLNSWLDVHESWAANGFYEPAAREAIDNPITMKQRNTWWNKNTRDYQFANLWRRMGLRGGDSADQLKTDESGGGDSWFDGLW